MEEVLAGLPWEICLLYLDDIIVHASTISEELSRLRKVFQRLHDAKLKLGPKKCFLLQKSVYFLGHVVSGKGVSTDPQKIKVVRTLPRPRTVKDARSFLGLCSYYRRFIQGFSDIARPLHRLTEEGREFKWSDDCEGAFNRLKVALTTTPILAFPASDDQFILDTDASNIGMGAVLSQLQGGREVVIAYYSKALSKSEINYCVTRKELLAIIVAVKAFHHYLCGRHFLIRTDHRALKWLLKFKNPEGQLVRWLEFLATYDFNIEHRPGRQHDNANALSRRPCGDCKKCERAESKERLETEVTETLAPGKDLPRETNMQNKNNDQSPAVRVLRPNGQQWLNVWVSGKTNEELRQAQLADSNITKVIGWNSSFPPTVGASLIRELSDESLLEPVGLA